ncbi:hypothetical protein SY85_18640 [Flavisolibacter tropicus]|uniref:Uncharacterized protein n=1 Tax=Flavisolibacter tropicus TaxID=1492898 RepID=A0A172TZP7_9BACT|nr:hypothetical protein SY85_18640 [Flavisolibacter tropicus]
MLELGEKGGKGKKREVNKSLDRETCELRREGEGRKMQNGKREIRKEEGMFNAQYSTLNEQYR